MPPESEFSISRRPPSHFAAIISAISFLRPFTYFSPTRTSAVFDREKIIRMIDIHVPEMQAVPLGIFYQRRGSVKPERVIVEHRGGEFVEIMNFQIRRCVGQKGKARGVRFGKAVVGEARDVRRDLVLNFPVIPLSVIPDRSRASIFARRLSARLKPIARPKLFRLAARESRDRPSPSQKLLLKERHAQACVSGSARRGCM